MNISIFAKPARWSNRLQALSRGSSTIRGEQIAEYLGAKLSPTEGYEDDICIYVKPWPGFKHEKHSYIDICDVPTHTFLQFNELHIPIIVFSLFAYEYFSKVCADNKIIFIPQQNCNFERFRRNRPEVTTVGISGHPDSFRYPIEDVRERLKKMGMELLVERKIVNRADAVNYYKKIDIQITWMVRPWITKNAMKLYNAASFGIPTVGLKQQNYKEFDGYYVPVASMDEMIKEIIKFKEDKEYYKQYSERIIPKAEEYHISSIAKLYKKLS